MSRSSKELLLVAGSRFLSALRLPRFLHSRLYQDELSILTYHAVIRQPLAFPDYCYLDERTFRQQIAYLRQNFTIIPLHDAVEKLLRGSLDKPTVAITFDDGYENNYEIAFPVLAEYDCPATIFLCTAYIDSDEIPWFCRLSTALTFTTKESLIWEGTCLSLCGPAQKSRASITLHQSLKKLHPARINELVLYICKQLGMEGLCTGCSGLPFRLLRSDAIRVMSKSGLVEFGAHTHTHTILSRLSPQEQRREILASVSMVEKLTGKPCRSFAYPNGSWRDYDQSTIELLKSAGIEIAASSIEGPNTRNTPVMQLRRYSVGAGLSLAEFQSMAHHIYHRLIRLGHRAERMAPTPS